MRALIAPQRRLLRFLKEPDHFIQHTHETINAIKSTAQKSAHSRHWLWNGLIQSHATLGSSNGLIIVSNRKPLWKYSALLKLRDINSRVIEKTYYKARFIEIFQGIRYANLKAGWADRNYRIITNNDGGINDYQYRLINADYLEKLRAISDFFGIGPKYARNFWMDFYDLDFRNSLALDGRTIPIWKLVFQSSLNKFKNEFVYSQYEKQVVTWLSGNGIEPWTADRLIFEVIGLVNPKPFQLWVEFGGRFPTAAKPTKAQTQHCRQSSKFLLC